ncbi:hypothetical protein BGZ98_002532 [Dissophora globulifera]|nr:hypothetical protein BGZ98_002532 [Dissophora globulifera]
MPSHSSAQAICTRILIRARSRTTLANRRHQSTFSFFSRNQDDATTTTTTTTSTTGVNNNTDVSSPFFNAALVNGFKGIRSPYFNGIATHSTTTSHKHALKTSASFEHAAPLLAAIHNKDQDTAWMIYSVLSRAGQLAFLLPLHHSLMLRSIRPSLQYRFTPEGVAQLTERFELVWRGMQEQAGVEPDINDYLARLEFAVATRQFSMVDATWIEMQERAETTTLGSAASNSEAGAEATTTTTTTSTTTPTTSSRPVIQPTLYTYNLILQSCVPRKNLSLATQTIAQMRRAGIQPDTMSWDYILQIHTAMRNWQAVESTFRSVFVTTALAMPAQVSLGGGGGSGGSSYQQQQQQQGGPLTSEWMTIPLGQRARSLHGGALSTNNNNNSNNSNSSTRRQKLVPSLQNIHTLFSYYAYTQDLEELRHMFDSHVRLFGLLPTTRSYNEMIKFAFLAKRDGDGLDLFRELVQIGQNLEKVQSDADRDAAITATATETQGVDHETSSQTQIPMQVMQQAYHLEPSDRMYRRTLAAMRRPRGGRGADESTIQAVLEDWEQMRARREKRTVERSGSGRINGAGVEREDIGDEGEENHARKELAQGTSNP